MAPPFVVSDRHPAARSLTRVHGHIASEIGVSRATINRTLHRHGLVTPAPKKRPRSSYVGFQADQPNEMWQADFTHYPLTTSEDAEIPRRVRRSAAVGAG
jgi:hypothetical protein